MGEQFDNPQGFSDVNDTGIEGSNEYPATGDEPQGAGEAGVNEDGSGVAGQDDKDGKYDPSKAIRAEKTKLKQKYEPYRQLVERLSKASGLSMEQLQRRLDEYLAGQAGVPSPPSAGGVYPPPEMSNIYNAVESLRWDYARLQRQIEESEIERDPKYSDWEDVRDDVYEYADERGVSLREAYWAVNGPRRAEQLQREAEQRAIARREQGELGVVTGDGSSAGTKEPRFENEDEKLVASIFGMSAAEFKALSGDDKNIDDWEEFLAKTQKRR